jgi:hypothetical protein
MNKREIDLLKKALKRARRHIAEHQKIPKDQRNESYMNDLKTRETTLLSWLNPDQKTTMTRSEFKETFRKALEIDEPQTVMEINNMEELEEAWPNIRGKSINIKAPDEIKQEIMRRWRKEFGHIKVKGFRDIKTRR